ncbi:GIY-YIG nuclease family protein [Biostraticola tofi]|uniref:Putative endonuclease n=1 Tax=Biostraticola tofi TaxID=466109 RepID=A0A4R3Z4Z6_9GAMM|nr:GIY-YIG nuclease family protein [Biostraticola tofi]TCV99059.1 putative endonuclease [Biostraticola tofi]
MTTCWYLYLVRTRSGILYTGITTDVIRRVEQHRLGTGAKALRGKGPLTLEFCRPAGDRPSASRWEYRVKQLSRTQKERLINQPEILLDDLWQSLATVAPRGRQDAPV